MKKSLLIIALISLAWTGYSQQIPSGIINAFEKGKAKDLTAYFNSNLEIKINDKVQLASKNQAVRMLNDFFKANPPSSFKVSSKGSKNGSRIGVGTLETKKGNYKISLYFMDNSNKKLIYYLSIEKSE